MKSNIRRAESQDASSIIEVLERSIQEICSKDYEPFEIKAWSTRTLRPAQWEGIIARDFVWVVENDNKVMGFGHLALMDKDEAEILGLYFVPEILNLGLGKLMFGHFYEVCHAHEIKRITLLSTRTAKTFYERNGFMISAGETTLEMQGVPIACYPMMKSL